MVATIDAVIETALCPKESLGNAGLSSVVIQKISAVASCRFEARNQALGS
jgi:hypothetical protein